MTDPQPSRSRVWLGRTARAATGLVALGLTVVVVAAGTRLPDAADASVPATRVPVPPSATTLVCPGPLILPDDTGRGDGAFDPTPVDPISTVTAVTASPSGPGTVGPLDRSTSWASLKAGGAVVQVRSVAGPSIVRAEPTDVPARVAAVGSGLVTAGDLRGLAAASCQQPVAEAWLLGGATDIASTAQLVIDNPGTTPAEIALEVWGPNGPVDLTGERYLVAPGAERVVVLGGIAAEQRRIGLHVVATGGRIGVHVQDSALDGFTPGGTDLVVPGSAPSTRQVVPGISVVASTVDDPNAPALRLLAPGHAATNATVTLLGPGGVFELPGVDTVALAAGEVTDVPLGGLPAGTYTAVVDAHEPVIASSVMSRPGSLGELDDTPSVERAWAAATLPGRAGVVALPAGTQGTLALVWCLEREGRCGRRLRDRQPEAPRCRRSGPGRTDRQHPGRHHQHLDARRARGGHRRRDPVGPGCGSRACGRCRRCGPGHRRRCEGRARLGARRPGATGRRHAVLRRRPGPGPAHGARRRGPRGPAPGHALTTGQDAARSSERSRSRSPSTAALRTGHWYQRG